MFFKAVRINAKIYHLHDPELIPTGMLLKLIGKKVIFDVHENIAEDIFDKPWIKNKMILYRFYTFFEKLAVKRFFIILAEKSYEPRFIKLKANYQTVLNYCDTRFFDHYVNTKNRNSKNLFYIGILLETRGVLQIAEAIYILKKKGKVFYFHCVGELYSDLYNKVYNLPFIDEIRSQMIFYGRQNLEAGYEISKNMGIGLCIIHPMKNSIGSYPTKMFEYMSIGLPQVTSNFPLYKSVVEKHEVGKCVNPLSPLEIAEAIEILDENESLRIRMSENGLEAVKINYDWKEEQKKIFEVYKNLLEA